MRVVAKKINNPDCDYFTEGMIYDVNVNTDLSFLAVGDNNMKLHCRFKNCSHIDGNWTIIGNQAVAVKSEEV